LTSNELQSQFGIADVLRFEQAPGGLIRAAISGPQADATVYLNGAHVAGWTPRGQAPVLFLSSKSHFEAEQPIRGGVPVIFPWFGPRGGGLPGPMHGFARVSEWSIESAKVRNDGAVELGLTLSPNEASRALGFDDFLLRFRVAFGASLEMELEVHNLSSQPLRFEEALHTYFAVADIRQVSVAGLKDTTYIDKTDAAQRKQAPAKIGFAKETDQVHLNTVATCEIDDSAGGRVIVVEKHGSETTVVWNPWIEKNLAIADMAPGEYQTMVCVETANANENAIVLPAGGVHQMGATIRVK
jgi:glucose-6-phosphate 1-epimerase